jgi:hypothetical protein
MMSTDPTLFTVKMGPHTAPGRILVSSVDPSPVSIKSQAARSARIIEKR